MSSIGLLALALRKGKFLYFFLATLFEIISTVNIKVSMMIVLSKAFILGCKFRPYVLLQHKSGVK